MYASVWDGVIFSTCRSIDLHAEHPVFVLSLITWLLILHVNCTRNSCIAHLLLLVFCVSVSGAGEAGGRGGEDDVGVRGEQWVCAYSILYCRP